MPKVTFIADADIRTAADDNGALPRQVREFKKGWSGSITTPQYERAKALGVITDDNAGAGQTVEENGSSSQNPRPAKSADKRRA